MPFYQIMWVVVLFLVPGLTMGLFASEKTNGTQELLMTSPITIWELVLGKYLAAAAIVTLLVLMLGLWTGDPVPLRRPGAAEDARGPARALAGRARLRRGRLLRLVGDAEPADRVLPRARAAA